MVIRRDRSEAVVGRGCHGVVVVVVLTVKRTGGPRCWRQRGSDRWDKERRSTAPRVKQSRQESNTEESQQCSTDSSSKFVAETLVMRDPDSDAEGKDGKKPPLSSVSGG